jgi:multimeric flavodoxin WrbA
MGQTRFWFMLMMLIYLMKHKYGIIKKSAEAVLDAIKEDGIAVIAEKTKYIFMSRYQT